MSNFESYLDRCAEAAETIDVEALSQLQIGDRIGCGGFYTMHSLGKLSVLGADVYCGVKQTNDKDRRSSLTEIRLMQDVEGVELLLRYASRFENMVPKFVLGISVDGNPCALLTEDASRGGEVDVLPLKNNIELADELGVAVKGAQEVYFDGETASYSLSFMAGGEERLLDFTPGPIKPASLGDHDDRVYDFIEAGKLTVDIEPDTKLGQSLAAAAV